MILSEETLEIFKTFARVYESIAINAGNTISTMSKSGAILASATVKETFTQPFAIFDLKKFCSIISMMDEPNFDFNDKFVHISSGMKHVDYYYCNAEHILRPDRDRPDDINRDISFSIEEGDFKSVLQGVDSLRLPVIAITQDNRVPVYGRVGPRRED